MVGLFLLLFGEICIFCEATAKSRLAPAGSVGAIRVTGATSCTCKIKLDTGGYKLDMIIQYSEHSALASFPCFPCVPWFVSHDKKMTNHGMHGTHEKNEN